MTTIFGLNYIDPPNTDLDVRVTNPAAHPLAPALLTGENSAGEIKAIGVLLPDCSPHARRGQEPN